MTELARYLEVTPSSLQRELDSLVRSGFLLRRQDGRRIYYKANTESPIFPEMKGPIERTVAIIPALKTAIKRFDDRIELALIYGSVARGGEKSGSDVDLMIVGSLKQIDLVYRPPVRAARLGSAACLNRRTNSRFRPSGMRD
jgi:DNA-binding transcriptional ArsR family regulator